MIILDTSFIIAHKIKNDSLHKRTTKIIEEIESGKYNEEIISDYIFNEVVTVALLKVKDLGFVSKLGDELLNAIKIIKIDDKLLNDSWEIFKSQKKTKLSFTDCSILAIMKERGIKHIATFDEDFKKIKGIKVVT